jgi:hypothetical protein
VVVPGETGDQEKLEFKDRKGHKLAKKHKDHLVQEAEVKDNKAIKENKDQFNKCNFGNNTIKNTSII